MTSVPHTMSLFEGLERAYRMAMGLEAAVRNKFGEGEPPFSEFAEWLFAAELVSLLDELRSAPLVQPKSVDDMHCRSSE